MKAGASALRHGTRLVGPIGLDQRLLYALRIASTHACDGVNGGLMFDQLFESFRKASESSLQAQQDMFKQWLQQWPTTPLATGVPTDWVEVQKRWLESARDALNKHRAVVDSTYRSGIDVIEHAFKVSEAKSPEDYRRLVEDLWRKLSDTFKAQSESQFREIQTATEKWLEKTRTANNVNAPS
jgi:hypothetical protein